MWAAILLAGGSGSRMGLGVNKVLLPLQGIPVIIRSLQALAPFAPVQLIVARPEEQQIIRGMAA